MPSIITDIKINTSSGVLNVGDSFYISAKHTAKTFTGAGAFKTGDFSNNNNGISSTNTINKQVSTNNIKGL